MKPLIIRDTREKIDHGWDFPECDMFRGTIHRKLDVGDYAVDGLEHLIFIDRKESVFELSQNMVEKRFHNLIQKARYYEYRYIICEFTLDELKNFPFNSPRAYAVDHSGVPLWKRIKMKGATIYKSIQTIENKYDIKFIFNDSKIEAEKYCYSLLREIYQKECIKNAN